MRIEINRWRWLLIGLLAWFYGGTAYLQWILPAQYSGFRGGPEIVVVSPEVDRILTTSAITTPLLFLSAVPVRFLSFSFLKAAGADEGALGHLSHTGKKHLFLADALSSIILAFGITSLVRLAARQIRLASELSEAEENLEAIRRKKIEPSQDFTTGSKRLFSFPCSFPLAGMRGMGKDGWKSFILLAGLALAGCAADPKQAAKFDPGIDRICAWTGLQRSGSIQKIIPWNSEPGHMVQLPLKVDGKVRRFEFVFEPDGVPSGFQPDPLSFIDLDKGFGENDAIDPAIRTRCLQAVRNFNRHFKAPLHGPGTILRWQGTYIVTFETISESEMAALLKKRPIFLDPYVSFLVTPRGTVYGVFWGC